jgi:uncharacterized protein with GYD domain
MAVIAALPPAGVLFRYEEGRSMASFLIEAAYTSEAWAILVKNPQDRIQVVQATIEKLGGKIEKSWLSFGDYDIVVIVDLPDSVSAAAFAMAISAGGSCRTVKTTPLLTVQEGLEAMKKAAASGYKPVVHTQTAR